MNSIASIQNSEKNIRMIRARSDNYLTSKIISGSTISITVFFSILGFFCPLIRPFTALFGMFIVLIDLILFDDYHKKIKKTGAKIQEEVDTDILDLPWNNFLIGEKVKPEEISQIVMKKNKKTIPLQKCKNKKNNTQKKDKDEEKITDWYNPKVSEVDLDFGRLICQRINISYDTILRKKYKSFIVCFGIAFVFIVLFVFLCLSTYSTLHFSEAVLLVVPFSSLFFWIIKEFKSQSMTLISLEEIMRKWEASWKDAIELNLPEKNRESARRIQDLIYLHRLNGSLIFEWIYQKLRTENETAIDNAVDELVSNFKERRDKNETY